MGLDVLAYEQGLPLPEPNFKIVKNEKSYILRVQVPKAPYQWNSI